MYLYLGFIYVVIVCALQAYMGGQSVDESRSGLSQTSLRDWVSVL